MNGQKEEYWPQNIRQGQTTHNTDPRPVHPLSYTLAETQTAEQQAQQ